MSEFGREVWSTYLENHFPSQTRPEIGYVDAGQIAELLYEMMGTFGVAGLEETPRSWEGSDDLDDALMDMAVHGDFHDIIELSAEGQNELALRMSFAIAAAQAEQAGQGSFRVPVPLDAPDEVKQMATLLYVLAGAARSILDDVRPLPAA